MIIINNKLDNHPTPFSSLSSLSKPSALSEMFAGRLLIIQNQSSNPSLQGLEIKSDSLSPPLPSKMLYLNLYRF